MSDVTIPETVPNWSEITPRYGRDYRSAAEVKAAFRAEEKPQDFTLAATGQAMSILDVAVGTTVLLRYKRHTMVTTLKVTQGMLDAARKAARA